MDVVHLWKAYGDRLVLRDLSFSAPPGVTCIEAPSGGGKTTLLRIVLGLEKADWGRVEGLEGARLAAVFQEDRLLLHATALENLTFVQPGAEEAGAELLEELGLPLSGQPVEEFSGGMRRRVALARALAAPSDALVLDEPFTGLDAESRAACLACLRRRGEGKVVLLASHNPQDARELDARVVRLPVI